MNRVRQIAPLIILVVLAIAGASYAQLAANAPQVSKIAVINSQKAFETSLEGKKALGQLQDLDARIKTELQKQDDAIRLLENRMNTGRLTMTNDALMGLQNDIAKKTTERKRYEEDQTQAAQTLSANLIQKIRVEMVAIIENLSKERGLELVLDTATSGVVTASPTIDITDEVVRRYDQSKAAAAPPVKK
jgi:Skp family chaperone for outer membrane proteins